MGPASRPNAWGAFIGIVTAATVAPTLADRSQAGDVRVDLAREYLVTVRGTVGDRSGLTFIIDTGTLPTLVDARLARDFLKAGPRTPVDSFTGTRELESVVAPSLAVGTFTAIDVPVLTADLSALEPQFGVKADVVLGVGVLRGACFSIDYARRILSFRCRDDWQGTAPLDRVSPLVVTDVTIDGTPLRLRVDTGSPAVVVYDNAAPAAWQSRVEAEVEAFDFSGPVRLRRLTAGTIALGPLTRRGTPVYILPAGAGRQSFHGVLGVRALGVSAVQFDLRRMALSWDH